MFFYVLFFCFWKWVQKLLFFIFMISISFFFFEIWMIEVFLLVNFFIFECVKVFFSYDFLNWPLPFFIPYFYDLSLLNHEILWIVFSTLLLHLFIGNNLIKRSRRRASYTITRIFWQKCVYRFRGNEKILIDVNLQVVNFLFNH